MSKPLPWNVFPAKLCFDGKMLICNGRVWIDATDKLMKALRQQRQRIKHRHE